MLDRLDGALSAAAGTATVLLAVWLLLGLLTAVALRVTDRSVGGRTRRFLDRALRLLAPGVAGRVLRTAVGLGVVGSAVFAGVAPMSSAVARVPVPVPSPAPVPLAAAPVADPAPARHLSTPLVVVAESTQPATDLWPLSPRQPVLAQKPRSPHEPRSHRRDVDPPASRLRGENPPRLSVVVLRGDTLWAIAARHLPAGASNASIDAAWRRWFDVNRAVIGPDPDLVLPGQILVSPARVVEVPG